MVEDRNGEEETLIQRDDDDTTTEENMLLGRRVARYFSKRFPRYSQNASIDEAWDYFENVTLPRRMSDGHGGYVKAPPGTKDVPTSLYPAWTTPQRALHDFGTGIAVYFSTLRALIVICFMAGAIYAPNLLYYGSEEYTQDGQSSLKRTLRGSLICTETAWVPCPNCTMDEWSDSLDRIAISDKTGLVFILKNECAPLRWEEGVNHAVVLLFLIAAMICLAVYQSKMERQYDEDVLTASDFSIKVDNPPPDATDPEEWKAFFEQFDGCQVVYCTVALNNEELVKALVRRRVLMQRVGNKVRGREDVPLQQISQDDAAETARKILLKRLSKTESTCRDMLHQQYDTSAIFVTFDTERAQRKVLETLSVGKVNIATNNTSVLPSQYLFRGDLVLDVCESVEPSAIRWQDLDETLTVKIFQRVCTGCLTVLIVLGGFVLVKKAFEKDLNVAALSIVVLNILVPNLFKHINRLEAHPSESTYQASLYVKICTFRWINTAIITTIIKPLTYTLSGGAQGLIPAIQAVLRAEIVIAPVVHMCDFVGHIKRQILAPMAANQAAMDMYFRGSVKNLGEKYTGMTKVVFVCFFYSVVFPASFFYGAAALSLIYVTDKFLLLRSWGPMPELGDDVAKLSRRVFFPLAILALAIMSEFYWSAYPFDNACEAGVTVDSKDYSEYIGAHVLIPAKNSQDAVEVTIPGDGTEQLWSYCDQDFLERSGALFRFFRLDKDAWMSDDQQRLTFLFGICVIVAMVSLCIFLCVRVWLPSLREAISGDYYTDEKDSGKRFSDMERIHAYVPQVRNGKFSYPLIASDVRSIDMRHIGWADPVRNHEFYNMAVDVEYLMGGDRQKFPVLSTIRCWPPISSTEESVRAGKDKSVGYPVESYGALEAEQ